MLAHSRPTIFGGSIKVHIGPRRLATRVIAMSAPAYKELHPKEAAEEIKKPGVVFLDVRSPQEFATGHYEGAVNVPIKLLGPEGKPSIENPEFEAKVKETLGDQPSGVVCTCFGGGRGGVAAGKLVDLGFSEVANLVGGMGAWAKEELPVVGEVKAPSGHQPPKAP